MGTLSGRVRSGRITRTRQPRRLVFARKPENDFSHYIYTYYQKCLEFSKNIEAIAGKWMFRDLIPGMSDFDTRFIVNDAMTADDWCRMSTSIGKAHLALCEKYPCWARNLEHLPGINLTWSELTSEQHYYPEHQQWSFYHSELSSKVRQSLEWLSRRHWNHKDEYFQLSKFCVYYGRYNRSIDPPINLGLHENKYGLHSRLMHYFTPAVQAAVSLIERRHFAGKFDALETAQSYLPKLKCWGPINEILLSNYENPKWYREPFLSQLEDYLEIALHTLSERLRDAITLIPIEVGLDINAWKHTLKNISTDPKLIVLESARFSRLMKGRLQFYAKAPRHFETSWLIGNELKRIGQAFFQVPFAVYWKIRTGEALGDSTMILDHLRKDLLTDTEFAATKEFARLTPGHWRQGQETSIALAIADVFDDFFKALTKISEVVYQSEETGETRS